MRKGHAVTYNTAARVYHYHYEDADFMYRRTFTGLYFNYRTFGSVPITPSNRVSLLALASKAKWLYFKSNVSITEANAWWRYDKERVAANRQGTRDFLQHLKLGEKKLDAFHADLCGKPPIPVKRS
jgi:hypothetical protein